MSNKCSYFNRLSIDDTIICNHANCDKAWVMIGLLDTHGLASGQKINLCKSSVVRNGNWVGSECVELYSHPNSFLKIILIPVFIPIKY